MEGNIVHVLRLFENKLYENDFRLVSKFIRLFSLSFKTGFSKYETHHVLKKVENRKPILEDIYQKPSIAPNMG